MSDLKFHKVEVALGFRGLCNSPSVVWDKAPGALQFMAITAPQMA